MWAKIYYYFDVGGWCMWGIALCSVLALAVFLERLFALHKEIVLPRSLAIEVQDLVRRGLIAEAVTLCRKKESPLGRVIQVGLENAGKLRERIKELVNEVGQREASHLGRYMAILNTTISVAPMLGFLGTVIGMVDLFTSVAAVGEVTNIGMIADGIYKALYTTVFGLVVAIPATLFYRFLSARVESLVLEMEEVSFKIVDLIKNE
ncbi:MAG: MotA/TolQ/ExbB proton channel family protein [Deltaproteobacteria bacterium]|nr:MotA/TolQ/ExbB proton channel family protein [Deltaproteobacteria bacterium]